MSGSQFVETLRQLGYSKAKTMDAKGYDWLFENKEIAPFLDWFCNNLSASNVVTPKEFNE